MDATANPIDLLFGGMAKLAPGDDAHSAQVLGLLPRRDFSVVVDAGCGTGRQTLVLARELRATIDALDSHAPFLDTLRHQAAMAGLAARIRTHAMDMADIPARFPRIDLLWSEGAAYSIGFGHALASWAPAIVPGGFLVASELTWLRDNPPADAAAFFATAYPDMRHHRANIALAEQAGYRLLATHTLPDRTWEDGYYAVLEPRARVLVQHESAAIRAFAQETLQEIAVFRAAQGSYGYVFYVLQRP